MIIRVQLQCMAASEIADMIPAETLAEIKKTDPTPLFKAYVVGHEGEASGYLIGVGNIVKKWAQEVVSRLHDKIKMGLELFHGHGQTNSHDGRLPIGRVVGKALKEIKGRFSTVVAAYIEPSHRRQNLDVASIEASIEMDMDDSGNVKVIDVSDVTGIALANSEIVTPGFPGATLLGQLAAFARKNNIQTIGYESKPRLRLGYQINTPAAPAEGGNGDAHAV